MFIPASPPRSEWLPSQSLRRAPAFVALITKRQAIDYVPVKGEIIIKEKSKQNITRDIEVKNNLTIAKGEWGGDSGKRGLQELL